MKKNKNPWTQKDQEEHFPSILEWWCTEGFFKTIENNKKWTFKGSLTEWCMGKNDLGLNTNLTLFNLDEDTHTCHYFRDDTRKLEIIDDPFTVKFKDMYIQGKYPSYKIKFKDPDNDIDLFLDYTAKSFPHWVAQDISKGLLPMGIGFYRYGFIPRNSFTGKLTIKDKSYKVKGEGYFEHVWGDFSYTHPFSNLSGIGKTVSINLKLIGWWIKHHQPKIPKSLKFSTENNPLGYDWIWAILDNGWSVFYGNILLFIMKGPVTGTLTLTKDGKKYTEFCDVNFEYKKTKYSPEFDIYYPTKIRAIAKNENEKLVLDFNTTHKISKLVSPIPDKKHWKAFVIYEAPGEVTGYYKNKNGKVNLTGKCKIEPQRQISVIGHNSLKIDFIKPPKGVGVHFDLDSHYLQKRIKTKIRLAPKPGIKFLSKKYKKR